MRNDCIDEQGTSCTWWWNVENGSFPGMWDRYKLSQLNLSQINLSLIYLSPVNLSYLDFVLHKTLDSATLILKLHYLINKPTDLNRIVCRLID